MNDAVYLYLNNRLSTAFQRCQWTDKVGQLFEQNILSRIMESAISMEYTTGEIDDFLKKAEAILNTEL